MALGAVISRDAAYVVYNTRDKVMRWNGLGEQKAREIMNNLAHRNTEADESRSCMLFANNAQAILETIKNSLKKKAIKGSDGRWYRRDSISVVDVYDHVHYVPLDEKGIRMLRILFLPSFKEKIQKVVYKKPLVALKYSNFDGISDGIYYVNHLDGDIAKLYLLNNLLDVEKLKVTMICFDFQYDYLKSYLKNKVNYQVITIDFLEELLEIINKTPN